MQEMTEACADFDAESGVKVLGSYLPALGRPSAEYEVPKAEPCDPNRSCGHSINFSEARLNTKLSIVFLLGYAHKTSGSEANKLPPKAPITKETPDTAFLSLTRRQIPIIKLMAMSFTLTYSEGLQALLPLLPATLSLALQLPKHSR